MELRSGLLAGRSTTLNWIACVLKSYPCSWKENMAQEVSVTSPLVDRANHHLHGCACCIKYPLTVGRGAGISVCFLDVAIHKLFISTLTDLGIIIRMVETEHLDLASIYHRRPVLLIPVVVPLCPHGDFQESIREIWLDICSNMGRTDRHKTSIRLISPTLIVEAQSNLLHFNTNSTATSQLVRK